MEELTRKEGDPSLLLITLFLPLPSDRHREGLHLSLF